MKGASDAVAEPSVALKVGNSHRVDVFADHDVRATFSGEVRHVNERGSD